MRSVHISMEVMDETALSVATWRPPGLMADWQVIVV